MFVEKYFILFFTTVLFLNFNLYVSLVQYRGRKISKGEYGTLGVHFLTFILLILLVFISFWIFYECLKQGIFVGIIVPLGYLLFAYPKWKNIIKKDFS